MPSAYLEEIPLSSLMLTALTSGVTDQGVPVRFCAYGSSMFPFIRDKDIISLSPIRQRSPHLGTVVAFIRPGTQNLIVHRVIGCKSGEYCLQGDNCSGHPDGWIPSYALIGYVSRVERSGRDVRLGLGPESSLIALISRLGILEPLVSIAARIRRMLRK